MAQVKLPVYNAVHDFRLVWKTLVLTDIVYKILAILILTSVVGVVFRAILKLSGRTVLADEDIVFFLMEPVGLLCVIIVAALWLGIFALEQTALMAVLRAGAKGHQLSSVGALQFALTHYASVLRLTTRAVTLILTMMAPFLGAISIIYLKLLTEYDINFYLSERPPVFLLAISLAVIILVIMISFILRLLSSWFFALPLLLFENVKVSLAFSQSAARTQGQRLRILKWVFSWAFINIILSTLISFLIIQLGWLIVPESTSPLPLLVFIVGMILVLWLVLNLIMNMLGTTTFAAVLFNLYRNFGQNGEQYKAFSIHKETHLHPSRFTLTRKRLIIFSLVAAIASLLIGGSVLYEVQLEDHAEIIAHRGASATTPENTLAAVQQAINDKADWVEIDVQETADGAVVVFHDSDFMKIANMNLKIWEATVSDLEIIDIGSQFSPAFMAQRVPLLSQVLAVCRGKIGVIIELKYYGHDQHLERRVAEIVEMENMQSDILIMSLKIDKVQKMKALRPQWTVGLLTSAVIGDLANVNVDFLAVNAGLATRDFIRSVHDNGKQIYAWTVNDASLMSTLIGRGVDGIITDRPVLGRIVLEYRLNINPIERMLLELAEILGVQPEIYQQSI